MMEVPRYLVYAKGFHVPLNEVRQTLKVTNPRETYTCQNCSAWVDGPTGSIQQSYVMWI